MPDNRNVSLGPLPHKEPEYGAKQLEVSRAMLEAWNWLEREGMLIHDPQQPAPSYVIFRRGEELIIQTGSLSFALLRIHGVDGSEPSSATSYGGLSVCDVDEGQ
jgi:hypothetical protein